MYRHWPSFKDPQGWPLFILSVSRNKAITGLLTRQTLPASALVCILLASSSFHYCPLPIVLPSQVLLIIIMQIAYRSRNPRAFQYWILATPPSLENSLAETLHSSSSTKLCVSRTSRDQNQRFGWSSPGWRLHLGRGEDLKTSTKT